MTSQCFYSKKYTNILLVAGDCNLENLCWNPVPCSQKIQAQHFGNYKIPRSDLYKIKRTKMLLINYRRGCCCSCLLSLSFFLLFSTLETSSPFRVSCSLATQFSFVLSFSYNNNNNNKNNKRNSTYKLNKLVHQLFI